MYASTLQGPGFGSKPSPQPVGRASTKFRGPDRAGLEPTYWILTANYGPGLGSNYRPVQGTNVCPLEPSPYVDTRGHF